MAGSVGWKKRKSVREEHGRRMVVGNERGKEKGAVEEKRIEKEVEKGRGKRGKGNGEVED